MQYTQKIIIFRHPQVSFVTSTPKIKEMTASSTSFTPTAQEEQMADEPVASSSHSATDTQRIKQQVEAPSTVFPRPGGTSKVCIFCGVVIKKAGAKRVAIAISHSVALINKIKGYAKGLEDTRICDKLQTCDVVGYHPLCILNYQKSYEKAIEKDKDADIWQETRDTHKSAFEALFIFIREEILEKGKVFYLQDL